MSDYLRVRSDRGLIPSHRPNSFAFNFSALLSSSVFPLNPLPPALNAFAQREAVLNAAVERMSLAPLSRIQEPT